MNLTSLPTVSGRRPLKYKKIYIDDDSGIYDSSGHQSIHSPFGFVRSSPHRPGSEGNGARKAPVAKAVSRPGTKPSVSDHQSNNLRALLDSALDPHVIFRAVRDEEGEVVDFLFVEVNEAACTANKLSRHQMVGHRLLELFPKAKKAGLLDIYRQALSSQQPINLKGFRYEHDIHS